MNEWVQRNAEKVTKVRVLVACGASGCSGSQCVILLLQHIHTDSSTYVSHQRRTARQDRQIQNVCRFRLFFSCVFRVLLLSVVSCLEISMWTFIFAYNHPYTPTWWFFRACVCMCLRGIASSANSTPAHTEIEAHSRPRANWKISLGTTTNTRFFLSHSLSLLISSSFGFLLLWLFACVHFFRLGYSLLFAARWMNAFLSILSLAFFSSSSFQSRSLCLLAPNYIIFRRLCVCVRLCVQWSYKTTIKMRQNKKLTTTTTHHRFRFY